MPEGKGNYRFRHALRLLDVGFDNALYIGDTYEDDYVGAQSAGIRCVLMTRRTVTPTG